MRIKILVLGLIFSFFFGCGTPMATLTNLYPQPPDSLYSQMLLTLQELKWTIESTDRPSFFILAKRLTSGEAFSAVFSGEKAFHTVTINFIKKNGETSLSVQVSQPGKIMKYNKVCEKLANEIIQKFEERIRK